MDSEREPARGRKADANGTDADVTTEDVGQATTAEEGMDAVTAADGHSEESAYARGDQGLAQNRQDRQDRKQLQDHDDDE